MLFTDGETTKFQLGNCSFILKFTSVNSGLWASSFFKPFFPSKQTKIFFIRKRDDDTRKDTLKTQDLDFKETTEQHVSVKVFAQ